MAVNNFFLLKSVILLAVIVGVRSNICDVDPCHTANHVCNALSESDYECVCVDGCSGVDCTDCVDLGDMDPSSACVPNPCERDCRCVESCKHAGGYYCRSDSGFLGKNCSIPAPTLRCEPDRMILSVSESFVKEFDMGLRNSYISVAPSLHQSARPGCKLSQPSNGVYEKVIRFPFNDCGMIGNDTGSRMVFTNQMWFNRRIANAMFDMPVPAATFQCSYNRVYKVVTSLKPVISTPSVITSERDIMPTISLCKVPTCPAACPELYRVSRGATYTVGERIHVTMSLDSGSSMTTGIAEMYLSCSRDVGASRLVDIVTGGCVADSDLPSTVRSAFSSHVVCVWFQTPQLKDCNEFFIHAELQSCKNGNTQNCPKAASSRCRDSPRSKRNTDSTIILGPILVVEGSSGKPTVTLAGMEDFDSPKVLLDGAEQFDLDVPQAKVDPVAPHNATGTTMLVVLCVAAALSLLVLVLILYSHNRRVGCA